MPLPVVSPPTKSLPDIFVKAVADWSRALLRTTRGGTGEKLILMLQCCKVAIIDTMWLGGTLEVCCVGCDPFLHDDRGAAQRS